MSTSAAKPGTVYLVGAGPGDPELITVRGLALLRQAGAVVYDALANAALLDEAPAQAERVFAGKRKGEHHLNQERINATLAQLAHEHAVVVRLKGGDPFVFGRGGEEMVYLRAAGIPVEIVPGVSSAIAAAAAAGVPVTQRQLSSGFAVVTGYQAAAAGDAPDWGALARMDTVVVLMGLANAEQVAQRLIAAGRSPDTPAMIVAAATLPTQTAVGATLGALGAAAAQLAASPAAGAPATLIVGSVVTLAHKDTPD